MKTGPRWNTGDRAGQARVRERCLDAVGAEAMEARDIVARLSDVRRDTVHQALARLVKEGELERPMFGWYRKPKEGK